MERVLLIDDDVELCSVLADYLSSNNLDIVVRNDARDCFEEAISEEYDLIVLDVMLPGVDGFSFLRNLRLNSDVGVLLLTARGEDNDRINGFELGADDYLPKPFNPKELIARMRAIMRRGKLSNLSKSATAMKRERLVVDGLVLNLASRAMAYEGRKIQLTDIEFELMTAFMESPGRVLTRESLVRRVFDRTFHPEDRSLDMSVSRLRKKLDGNQAMGDRIKTVRSAGYVFSVSERN